MGTVSPRSLTGDAMDRTKSGNIKITADELAFILSLDHFDLKMVLSEINDHGWPVARKLLPLISATLGRKVRP